MSDKSAEAKCLIEYICKECGCTEKIYNATNVSVPLVVNCLECGKYMKQLSYNYVKDYVPNPGTRIFINQSRDYFKKITQQKVKVNWGKIKTNFKTKKSAIKHYMNDFNPSETMLVVYWGQG